MTIKVLVSGSGSMGREVLAAACREDDLEPVAVVDLLATGDTIDLPDGSGAIPLGTDLAAALAEGRPDVIVDFTNADWAPTLIDVSLKAGVRLVIGTSGLPDILVEELGARCAKQKTGAVLASNFALGAVLMQHMAKTAARFYDNAEIIEQHHDRKVDAPSGTSIATAKLMSEARGKPFVRPEPEKLNAPGTRGGEIDGVTIHSTRLPGLVAHQQVIFGSPGETLEIRHNSIDRVSFMPGVVLAIRRVMELDHLVIGLDQLIGLTD